MNSLNLYSGPAVDVDVVVVGVVFSCEIYYEQVLPAEPSFIDCIIEEERRVLNDYLSNLSWARVKLES